MRPAVRSTRALFGAFGGGLTLAIAASAALLAVSSVVAFRGWPQSDAAPQNPEVAQLKKVRAEQSKSAAVVPTVALPKAAAPVVRHHAGAKARHHAKARARHARPGRTRGTHHTVSTAATTTGKHHASTAPTDQTSNSHVPATGGKPNPAKPVSDTVSNTTKAAANAVAPTAPQVSGALQSIGAAGAGTVDKAGATAGKVVSSLTGG